LASRSASLFDGVGGGIVTSSNFDLEAVQGSNDLGRSDELLDGDHGRRDGDNRQRRFTRHIFFPRQRDTTAATTGHERGVFFPRQRDTTAATEVHAPNAKQRAKEKKSAAGSKKSMSSQFCKGPWNMHLLGFAFCFETLQITLNAKLIWRGPWRCS